MGIEAISFILGVLLLGVAVLGGGIEIKELKIPKVTRLARLLSGCVGLALILLGLWIAEIIPHVKEPKTTSQEPTPDLIIDSLTHSPDDPNTTDKITFTAIVKNKGQARAGPSTLELKVGDETVPETFPVPALGPDKTFPVQWDETLSVAQSYRNTATADVTNAVSESDEDNNQKTDEYQVVAVAEKFPDLIIESLTHSPERPTTADAINFIVVVKNIGQAPADSSTLGLKFGAETDAETHTVPALGPGESHIYRQRLFLRRVQKYCITATADFTNGVAESDENNNHNKDDYHVAVAAAVKPPDLIIERLTHSPLNPTTADKIIFTVVVKNVGRGTAGPSSLAFMVGGEVAPKTYPIPALGPGNTHTVKEWDILSVARRYGNTAMADIKNQVRESNEKNNHKTEVCLVRPKPPPGPPVPTQLSPANGTVFKHYPRRTILKWKALPGAPRYSVETAFKSGNTWSSPKKITNIKTTTYTFNFVGAQPGRWRVWAVYASGKESPKTGWWEFRYTR